MYTAFRGRKLFYYLLNFMFKDFNFPLIFPGIASYAYYTNPLFANVFYSYSGRKILSLLDSFPDHSNPERCYILQ